MIRLARIKEDLPRIVLYMDACFVAFRVRGIAAFVESTAGQVLLVSARSGRWLYY